jgi:hypothetical protein
MGTLCIAQKKSVSFGSLQHGAFLTESGAAGFSIMDSNQPGFLGSPFLVVRLLCFFSIF